MSAKSGTAEAQIKRLYRESIEYVKYLDQVTKDKETLSPLFQTKVLSTRTKLCDACEKILFLKPLEFGKKAEEIIWRKCFYEPIHIIRRNMAGLSDEERQLYYMHLTSASGYYISVLIKLQHEFKFKLPVHDSTLNFLPWNTSSSETRAAMVSSQDDGKSATISSSQQQPDKKIQEFAFLLAHRIFIYLGDLARYQLEFDQSPDPRLAQHYYHLALRLKPYHGQPYNQLGTLCGGRNCGLDAAFYYLRCIFSAESFMGADGNLTQLLERNTEVYKKVMKELESLNDDSLLKKDCELRHFLAGYLNLFKIFYDDSDEFDTGLHLQELSQLVIQSFSNVVFQLVAEKSNVQSALLLKIFVSQMILIKKLQDKGSLKLSASIALLISLVMISLDHLIVLLTGRLKPLPVTNLHQAENFNNDGGFIAKPYKDNKFTAVKKNLREEKRPTKKPHLFSLLRRRRRVSGDDEALSDSETVPNGSKLSDSENNSDDSDDDVIELDESDSEEKVEGVDSSTDKTLSNGVDLQENGNTKIDPTGTSQSSQASDNVIQQSIDLRQLEIFDMISYLSDSGWLIVMKVVCDWFRCNPNLIISIGEVSRALWGKFADFLNLLPTEEKITEYMKSSKMTQNELNAFNMTLSSPLSLNDWLQKYPLVEDVFLRGVTSLAQAHSSLDFELFQNYSLEHEAIVRLCSLRSFGYSLLRLNTPGFRYDKTKIEFVGPSEGLGASVVNKEESNRENLMRNMAKLRIKDEMETMEKVAWIPVYLVVDSNVLCNTLPTVRKLSTVRKFVCVVPNAVVDKLDLLKKDSADAREAIRWLENQFKRGSKFVRAQKFHEKTDFSEQLTPLLAENQNKREITGLIDCSAYLSRTVTSSTSTVVCILTNKNTTADGNNSINDQLDVSAILTLSIATLSIRGVSVEDAQSFWERWKKYDRKGNA